MRLQTKVGEGWKAEYIRSARVKPCPDGCPNFLVFVIDKREPSVVMNGVRDLTFYRLRLTIQQIEYRKGKT